MLIIVTYKETYSLYLLSNKCVNVIDFLKSFMSISASAINDISFFGVTCKKPFSENCPLKSQSNQTNNVIVLDSISIENVLLLILSMEDI